MIIDFQHHFMPLELAKRRGFDASKPGNLMEGGIPKLTVHERLYNMDAQIRDMDLVGIDVAALLQSRLGRAAGRLPVDQRQRRRATAALP